MTSWSRMERYTNHSLHPKCLKDWANRCGAPVSTPCCSWTRVCVLSKGSKIAKKMISLKKVPRSFGKVNGPYLGQFEPILRVKGWNWAQAQATRVGEGCRLADSKKKIVQRRFVLAVVVQMHGMPNKKHTFFGIAQFKDTHTRHPKKLLLAFVGHNGKTQFFGIACFKRTRTRHLNMYLLTFLI